MARDLLIQRQRASLTSQQHKALLRDYTQGVTLFLMRAIEMVDLFEISDYATKRRPRNTDYKSNPEEHFRNKGRADLFKLELGALYIVTGTIQHSRTSRREDRTLMTLVDVEVREYCQERKFDDLPVIGKADHFHASTPTKNVPHLKLDKFPTQSFIGKLLEYKSTRITSNIILSEEEALERRTFDLSRDIRLHNTLRDMESRFRRYLSRFEAISQEEREAWVGASYKKIERLEFEANNYIYIPWVSKPEILKRIEAMKNSLQEIEELILCQKGKFVNKAILSQRQAITIT